MPNNLISAVRSWSRNTLAEARAAIKLHYSTKLGVLGIMKNEAMNLDEWVEHYLWMGAGKIYLIDNGSTDDTVAKAQAWVTKGRVELVEYPERHRQREHYWQAFQHFRIDRTCEWLLVADLDEFWFCPGGDSLVTALQEFKIYEVIYANWTMFGSSGHVDHPQSVREAFTWRRRGTASHLYTKYMFRTARAKTARAIDVHKFFGADSSRTVSDGSRFQINHYQNQSLDYFRSVKMVRGDCYYPDKDRARDLAQFHASDEGCDQQDLQLADLVAAARKP